MRTLIVVLIAALTIVFFAGPSFAQAMTAQQPAQTKVTEPAKPEMPKATRLHHLIGEVVSVDQAAKTVEIKHTVKGKEKEATFTVGEQAAPTLATLKPGDRVKISYQRANGQLTAQSIAETHRGASK
jgi:Cu/Ag efflux protein CusF